MLKRRTVTSQVIEHILALIKKGNMKPGDKMPTEKDLTDSLGVSRTCVREAVKSLESLGIIRVKAKVGAILLDQSSRTVFGAERMVSLIHAEESDALIDFRNIIETGVAALAAERAQEEDLAAMRKAIDEYKYAMKNGEFSYQADLDFHVAVARAARNPIAVKTLEMLLEPLATKRRLTNFVPGAAEDGLKDHVKILEAIEELNPEKARRAMSAHMKTAKRYYRIASANVSTSAANSDMPSTKTPSGYGTAIPRPPSLMAILP